MINYRLFLLVFFLAFLPFCSMSRDIIKDTVINCRVVKINKARKSVNSTNKAFIILLQDTATGRYFNVVSLKEKRSKYKLLDKIKKNRVYSFNLHNYSGTTYIMNYFISREVCLKGLKILIPPNDYTGNIHTTSNLVGMHYLKE